MTFFELAAAIITLVSIWLATRENIWYYPTGVVSLVMYTWLFYQAKLYAESLLQVTWLVLMIYGWYEWLRSENPKQPRVPFRYTVDDEALFAFAGLFGFAKIGEQWVTSATILTTRANEVCAPVHDRMPVVLAGPDEEAAWLEGADDPALLEPLAAPRTTARPA